MHGSDLMVSSDQQKLGRHEQLLGKDVGHHLKPIHPSVHVVSEEEKGGRREDGTHSPKDLLKTDEVMKIAMEVTWIGKRMRILSGLS